MIPISSPCTRSADSSRPATDRRSASIPPLLSSRKRPGAISLAKASGATVSKTHDRLPRRPRAPPRLRLRSRLARDRRAVPNASEPPSREQARAPWRLAPRQPPGRAAEQGLGTSAMDDPRREHEAGKGKAASLRIGQSDDERQQATALEKEGQGRVERLVIDG